MTAVVLAVAAVAAWVSYWHAVAVIEKYGAEDELSAHLVPATVDGMIYASSMVLLWCARYRLAVPALARWALALGVAATLAANILHGIERGPLAAALAAWPAIALVISYELIMWVVRSGRELADRARDPGQPERARAEPTAPSLASDRAPQPEPVVHATPQSGQDAPADAVPEDGDRRAQVAALLAQDPNMTGAALARALGVHETTGRKYRREALNGHSRA
ncbi:DUF2637 domain-containing protein [Nonomuraea turcica]|uniref:DUF2637 domain-containing protein n=1 Tax=Nonomuraea sp. G32 TaxID=3067274 RepID=UPI00273C97D4|nr:DUF2637 domain-containing protein [Nonomuraea sp. G32]MDP4501720.1 DUF2637 domain-containing protein [Nonomuraea sp. G32]